jgi:ribosome-binding protein aMBF1 (putative translation factor)
VRRETELAATIRAAMHDERLKEEDLSKALGISSVMLQKLLCGEVIPSSFLQKQMREILGISRVRIGRISSKRQQKSKKRQLREASQRKKGKLHRN